VTPDRHRYYNLSAIKPTGRCLECGDELPKRGRKYGDLHGPG